MLLSKPPLMKDTRSFQDKAYVSSMCYRVQDFLQRCEENKEAPQFQYTEKTLRTPTKSDFRNIFEYLFQQLDEGYQLHPKNVEEEVPKLLQALGYPYPLKKSTMSTIGAPHSWPPLLAALDWLITVIEEKELETYRNLLQKDDMDEELANLKARRLNNEKTIQQIKEDIEREKEECRKMMTDNTDLENDISKLKDYCLESSVTISRVEENIVRISRKKTTLAKLYTVG
uniref:Kinetochore protein NDC80 n=1 Tax=Ditylenchus dipsaci TaxID=166011 RepID=A0A915E2Q2_9BILA